MGLDTWDKLRRAIEDGVGQGHRDNYQPWLKIRRRNPSKQGNQQAYRLPGYRRQCHFMALVESYVALLCLYLGAWDVREQFPLWPMRHLHPLADLAGASVPTGGLRGLVDIARDAGIAHGVAPGSRGVPYVATLDIAVTVRCSAGFRLAGISGKPREQIVGEAANDRTVERLQLADLYLREAGAPHVIVDSHFVGQRFGENLESFSACALPPAHLADEGLIQEFAEAFIGEAQSLPLGHSITRVAAAMRLDEGDAEQLFRHCGWTRRIPVDLSNYVDMGAPMRPVDPRLLERLARELFGEFLP